MCLRFWLFMYSWVNAPIIFVQTTQISKMVTMLPVVLENGRNTRPAFRGLCLSWVCSTYTHACTPTCIGVRSPLGTGLRTRLEAVYMEQAHTCFSASWFWPCPVPFTTSIWNFGFLMAPTFPSLLSIIWDDLPVEVGSNMSARSSVGNLVFSRGRREEARGGTREGSEGSSLPRIWLL